MSIKFSHTAAFLLTATTVAAAQPLVLEKYTVRDSMAVNRDAVTFLKPRDWRVEGGIRWYPNLMHQANLEMRIYNPNGPEQIEALRTVHCCWLTNPVVPMARGQNYLGTLVLEPIEDPREIVRQYMLPQLRALVRPKMTGYRELPDVAKALANTIPGARIRSGKVRVEYQLNGQEVEEDFYISLYSLSVDLGVNNCRSIAWGPAWPPFALRAAKGRLDEMTPLLLSVVNSGRMNPRWFAELQYVCELFKERMQGTIRSAREISDYITRNNEEISRIYSEAYRKQSAVQDRAARQFSNYIRGVEQYESPFERYPVQLPSGYRHAWASASGGYILSNDSGFNPNVGSTTDWQLLKVAD